MAAIKSKSFSVSLPEGARVGILTEEMYGKIVDEPQIYCDIDGYKTPLFRVTGNLDEGVCEVLAAKVNEAVGEPVDYFAAIWACASVSTAGVVDSGYFACLAVTETKYAFTYTEA